MAGPDIIAMPKGCLALAPLIAFHSKKLSTGSRQRRRRYASRKIGNEATVLRVNRPPAAAAILAAVRDQAPPGPVERPLADLLGLADTPALLARCAVVLRRKGAERLDQIDASRSPSRLVGAAF